MREDDDNLDRNVSQSTSHRDDDQVSIIKHAELIFDDDLIANSYLFYASLNSGFSVSVCGRQHIFKPVSVQAMW